MPDAANHFAQLLGLDPSDLGSLLDRARRRRFDAGEVVCHAGDPADTMHVVRSGHFAVRITTEFGATATINIVGPGDAFGELALLTPGEPRSATVAALEGGETLSVHELDFGRLRAERPETDAVLTRLLAARVRGLSEQLVEALYLPVDTRVRRRLLGAVAVYGAVEPGATLPLTQEELASLAGTSRATVNRVLREEQEHGAVELTRGRTTLVDPEALARRARGFGG
ncbi:MAG TPA: Crp/Fnr family transcriptional regulator [Capillimicrobium sp.]|jgi:CRP-like cAMP-binding protein